MIKLVTDVMSNPRVQESIIAMLESRLRMMNVKFATHLVLMAMQARLKNYTVQRTFNRMIQQWDNFYRRYITAVIWSMISFRS